MADGSSRAGSGALMGVWVVGGLLIVWALGYGMLKFAVEGVFSFVGYGWADTLKPHAAQLESELATLEHEARVIRSSRHDEEYLERLERRRLRVVSELEEARRLAPLPRGVTVVARLVIAFLTPLVMLLGAVWLLVADARERREALREKQRSEEPGERAKRMELLVNRYMELNPGRLPPALEERLGLKPTPKPPPGEPPLEPKPPPLHHGCVRLVIDDRPREAAPSQSVGRGPQVPRRPEQLVLLSDASPSSDANARDPRTPPPLPKTRAKVALQLVENAVAEAEVEESKRGPPRHRPQRAARDVAEDDDREDSAADGELSEKHWLFSTDAGELIRYAIARLPAQHLSLVLAELAECAWPAWHRAFPHDWRPAWCVATVRAWCFGEATIAQVLEAKEGAWEACRAAVRDRRHRGSIRSCALSASRVMSLAGAYVETADPEQREASAVEEFFRCLSEAVPNPEEEAIEYAETLSFEADSPHQRLYWAFHGEVEQERARERHARAWSARAAETIQLIVPYPAEVSKRWVVVRDRVLIEGAVLHLEGWKVRRYELEPWAYSGRGEDA